MTTKQAMKNLAVIHKEYTAFRINAETNAEDDICTMWDIIDGYSAAVNDLLTANNQR